jgi:outer membrane protein OmpA-like peptidoglycan-associated protein
MKPNLLASILLIYCCGSIVLVGQDMPRADLFLGYSFLRANSARTIPAFTMNGGAGTLGLNINNHVGLEFEFGGYHNGSIHGIQFDTTHFTYLFGPRFSIGRSKKVDPYFHTLFGGAHVTSSIAQENTPPLPGFPVTAPASGRFAASQDTFAMAVGGGLDIKLSHHATFRPIQLDYVLTRLEDLGLTGQPSQNRNQNNLRYAAGIMFTFGGERPSVAPPITTKPCPGGTSVPIDQECPKRDISLAINVSKNNVCAGDIVNIAPIAALPDAAALQWTINGDPASQTATLDFNTAGRAAGSYKIGMKATAEGFNDAFAETPVTVLEYRPPSGTLQVSPAEIWVGEKATLSANFSPGQCGGTLKPATFTASEGSVSDAQYQSSGVQFDPSNNSEQRKTITLAANVADDKGSASAQASIVVKKKAAIMAKRLPDIVFPTGSDRVNNCGKRVLLEELKATLDNEPGGKVVFVGHQTDNEAKWTGLDQKRALNAAAVISAGQGICAAFPASQIYVSAEGAAQNGVDPQPHFCGASAGAEKPGQGVNESDDAAKYRRVEVWFVPTGGMLPPLLKDHKDAATLSVSALGCPR